MNAFYSVRKSQPDIFFQMTASIASFCLGVIMVTVVLVSRYLKINPDNVATPIAASLGDLTTLSLLAGISNGIHGAIGDRYAFSIKHARCLWYFFWEVVFCAWYYAENHPWVAPVILGVYLVSISLWIHLAKQNSLTEKVLYTGWTPVLSAMVISRSELAGHKNSGSTFWFALNLFTKAFLPFAVVAALF